MTILSRDEALIRWLLYQCVRELEYVRCVESPGDHSLCATSTGEQLIAEGMKALGVKDLSIETADEFLKWLNIEYGESL